MQNVIMLGGIVLSVTMLSVIIQNVIVLSVIILSVIMLSVIIQNVIMLSVVTPFANQSMPNSQCVLVRTEALEQS